MSQIANIVEVVKAVEAKKRKDFPLRPGVTFFSEQDVWLFQEIQDERICIICRTAAIIDQFLGNNLRINFPRLELIDENLIKANVHKNCRCFLVRQIG